ncbi:MAG: conserved membrane protein of unknown function [Candidatus Thorarchaeota archaeon]|nr:MAG: conserved membrane protein of unknown function [Candidatus Thorarchaeota archaeon]
MEIDSGPDPFSPDEPFVDEKYKVSAIEAVSRTLSLFFRKFGTYALVGLAASIFALSVILVLIFVLPPLPPQDLQEIINAQGDLVAILTLLWENFGTALAPILLIMAVLAIIGIVYYTILGGAATNVALENYGDPSRGEFVSSLSKAFGRTPTLFLYQILVTLLTVLLLLPGFIAFAPLLTITDPTNIDMAVLEAALIGVLLLLIGVIILFYLLVRLTPAIAVIMAEDVSAFGAISRSIELTSGNFLHVFGARIGLAIASMVIGLGIDIVVSFLPGLFYAIGYLFLSAIILTSLDYIFAAVIYKDLLARRKIVETGGASQDWW